MPGRGGGPRAGPSPRQAGLQEVARRHFASEGPWQEAREGEVSFNSWRRDAYFDYYYYYYYIDGPHRDLHTMHSLDRMQTKHLYKLYISSTCCLPLSPYF